MALAPLRSRAASRGTVVDEYLAGRGEATSYDAVQASGFSHGFGSAPENRELVEWMRAYNADRSDHAKLRFYGFDSPTEYSGAESPRQLLAMTLEYLESVDPARAHERGRRIEELIGDDAAWSNPAVMFDPGKSVGASPAATTLRIETEELISELRLRTPDVTEAERKGMRRRSSMHGARQLLNYHAGMARSSPNRIEELLGIRDPEHGGQPRVPRRARSARARPSAGVRAQQSPEAAARSGRSGPALAWWPAGTCQQESGGKVCGDRDEHSNAGLGRARAAGGGHAGGALSATAGSVRLIPTHLGMGLPTEQVKALPTRSVGNPGFFPFTPQSVDGF